MHHFVFNNATLMAAKGCRQRVNKVKRVYVLCFGQKLTLFVFVPKVNNKLKYLDFKLCLLQRTRAHV